ncbi:hypothetical protein AAF712_013313 [Marasmius tenuissimus]|uniref:Uncharacterized protein n=1 Tax=Marasmius tenuissimus TaxID=585030 RepID=A0ABR2ZGL5_9AGAR
MAKQVWCAICNANTSKWHELQHCRSHTTLSTTSFMLPTIPDLSLDESSNSETSESPALSTIEASLSLHHEDVSLQSKMDNRNDSQDNFTVEDAIRELAQLRTPVGSCIPTWLARYPLAEIHSSDCEDSEELCIPIFRSGKGSEASGGEASSEDGDYWGENVDFDSEDPNSEEEDQGFDWEVFEKAASSVSASDRLREGFEVDVANQSAYWTT